MLGDAARAEAQRRAAVEIDPHAMDDAAEMLPEGADAGVTSRSTVPSPRAPARSVERGGGIVGPNHSKKTRSFSFRSGGM